MDAFQEDVSDALGFCHWHLRIPYGAVVCTAILISAEMVTHWNGESCVLESGRTVIDDGFGDYSIGRWCWQLADVQLLDPPVPAKGRQGWWRWSA